MDALLLQCQDDTFYNPVLPCGDCGVIWNVASSDSRESGRCAGGRLRPARCQTQQKRLAERRQRTEANVRACPGIATAVLALPVRTSCHPAIAGYDTRSPATGSANAPSRPRSATSPRLSGGDGSHRRQGIDSEVATHGPLEDLLALAEPCSCSSPPPGPPPAADQRLGPD